jgi:hypothetical protein
MGDGWKHACNIVFQTTKDVFKESQSISIFVNEIISIDKSWISIHSYIPQGWKHIPILLTPKKIVGNCG